MTDFYLFGLMLLIVLVVFCFVMALAGIFKDLYNLVFANLIPKLKVAKSKRIKDTQKRHGT